MADLHITEPDHCLCGGVGFYVIRCTPKDKTAQQPKCAYHGTAHTCICTIQDNAGHRRDAIRADCGLNLLQQARLTIGSFDPRRSPFAREIHSAMVTIVRGEEPRPWFVLLGRPGTGKTHALGAIVAGLVAEGISARYTTADDFLEDVREGAFTDGDSSDKRLKPYYDKPVLALDDLRLDMLNTRAQENWVERLLLKRYEQAAVTILASNNDLDEFPQRIRSRIEDPSMTRLVVTEGPDERRHIDPDTGEILEGEPQ